MSCLRGRPVGSQGVDQMDSGPGCGGVASFPIVFGDFSRVRVSPLLPDPNLSKVPRGRDGSGCSDLGSIRPRNPQSVPRAGHGPQQSSPLSLEVPKKQPSAVSKDECQSWRQRGGLGSTFLAFSLATALPALPERTRSLSEQRGRAVWCSVWSDHLLLECSLGLPPPGRCSWKPQCTEET